MNVVVELASVSVVRGESNLLDKISWMVSDEQRWVIVGPNGAGKTTLLQILAAQMFPTSGVVGLLGEVVGTVDVFELRPRIGVCSASIAERIPRNEKVSDVVLSASYGVLGRWKEQYEGYDEDRCQQLMRRLQVEHLVDRTFGTLSEGERKRVEIARALMTDPELLLLDEPGAGLDLAGRESLIYSLDQMVQDPKAPTIIMVTHHLEEIPVGITHALLLNSGRVVASGPIEQTLTEQNLANAYNMPLKVSHVDKRWSARAQISES